MSSKEEMHRSSIAESRQRVLLVTHCFDADYSMESRLSWFRAKNAARKYDVTVICAEPYADLRCDLDADIPGVDVISVPHTALEKLLIRLPVGFYLAYRLWHRRVLGVVRKLHARAQFALVHQVSYCGYREPGDCWKLGVPFVWGPIGGTQNVPWRFLSLLNLSGAAKEFWRSVVNRIQLRFGRRVGLALRAADKVFVANREVQQSFRQARGVELLRQLEIGIERVAGSSRSVRDQRQPLRVLWAGRLEDWKGLPLLLHSVAQLPKDFGIELRVVGSGSRERRLKRLATKLGISDSIQWLPLPAYGSRQEHYQWADVFAFTSLRDTSGTGLLESLAAGVPIIGLDHQGARDIMTEKCAVRVPVDAPKQVVEAFAEALKRLSNDSELLHRYSQGAIARAREFHWEKLDAEMNDAYASVLSQPSRVRSARVANVNPKLRPSTPFAG